ncbi:MAG: response regulator transcription factor [Anaerolineae bacterium]|nr:response regulator transcription factor [Anaerolineae bacterium]
MAITVFLADDHAVVRDGLHALLDAESDIAVVGTAANGRDAVHQVTELHPDVVVVDIVMPDLGGVEATRQIHETSPSTQVVILSMYASDEYVRRALQAGARGYLLKESAGKEVIDAVRAVHAGRRYLGEEIADRLIDGYLDLYSNSEAGDPLAALSPRELEVLQLVVEGKTSPEIAGILTLSPKTIDTYRSRLMRKLGIGDIPGLVKFAIKHGLTSAE